MMKETLLLFSLLAATVALPHEEVKEQNGVISERDGDRIVDISEEDGDKDGEDDDRDMLSDREGTTELVSDRHKVHAYI